MKMLNNIYYRTPTKVREGNVFKGVCHSVQGDYFSSDRRQVSLAGVGMFPVMATRCY